MTATDYDLFVGMLKRAGVVYIDRDRMVREAIPGSGHPPEQAGHWRDVPMVPAARTVTISADGYDGTEYVKAPKNDGYGSFFTVFDFNPDGSLDTVGVWE
jgi:hypothetical protein